MTQKELLYLEDAVNHEKNIIAICNNILDSLEDEELISFLEDEINKHYSMHEKLIDKMEELSNE